jgi:hypothetical protein
MVPCGRICREAASARWMQLKRKRSIAVISVVSAFDTTFASGAGAAPFFAAGGGAAFPPFLPALASAAGSCLAFSALAIEAYSSTLRW